MKAIVKKLIDEINGLLEQAKGFTDRYNTEEDHAITPQLKEDLLYFHKRTEYIFNAVNDKSCTGALKGLYVRHLMNRLNKSSIDHIDEALIEVKTRLSILKKELENGLLFKTSDLIEAEVFSDFLEYAKYLLDKGYIHSVPVIVGSVLEQELRSISEKNGLPTKTDKGKNLTLEPLNENVGKAGIYDMKVQKRITSLAQIRNDAAHGDYEKFNKEDAEDFYKFVLNFDY